MGVIEIECKPADGTWRIAPITSKYFTRNDRAYRSNEREGFESCMPTWLIGNNRAEYLGVANAGLFWMQSHEDPGVLRIATKQSAGDLARALCAFVPRLFKGYEVSIVNDEGYPIPQKQPETLVAAIGEFFQTTGYSMPPQSKISSWSCNADYDNKTGKSTARFAIYGEEPEQ